MSDKSLTIVLPVHNGESRLANCVTQMLELASDLTPQFSIMIVDDGSTDDTSLVAEDLATRYPQVTVERQREQSGLGPIVSMVRRKVSSDVVIMHDGVTPIDPVHVRRLWRQSDAQSSPAVASPRRDMSELANVRAMHSALAAAHQRVMGFHLLEPVAQQEPAMPLPNAPKSTPRSRPKDLADVGQIPVLPRPNFLSAIAEFTLGE